ncbi:MAG: hypothetical protein VX246_02835 [Myxococcota bacterium]|nr:hypothetical protein [Myxococcota bacterium]
MYRAPLDSYRVSVLWKADVYRDEAERQRAMADCLSFEDVARVFEADLAEKGSELRLDLDGLEDGDLAAAFGAMYPEAVPIDALRSLYDA